jgi:hypothetical protein
MYGIAFVVLFILLHFLLFCKFVFAKVYPFISRRMALIIILSLLLYSRYVWEYTILMSCSDWEKGLNGTMVHSAEFCEIPVPRICPYELVDRYQDFSFSDCSSPDKSREVFTTWYKSQAPFIGLPHTNQFNQRERTFDKFPYTIYANS